MSDNYKIPVRYFGDAFKLTNCILDSGSICHMTPQVLDFIPGSLEDKDKYIEVAGGHHITTKQKGQVQIKICDNNGDTFIVSFHNVLLAPDLYNRLFLIITFLNSVHTCLFH